MKKRLIIIVCLFLSLLLSACSNSDKLTKAPSSYDTLSISIEESLSSINKNGQYLDFTKQMLDDDILVFWNCIFSKKSFIQVLDKIIINNFNNNKIVGQKYMGFEGSDKWMNPIVEYDVQSKIDNEIFKKTKGFENVVLQGTNGNKLLLSVFENKNERWDMGKEKFVVYNKDLNNIDKVDFQFKKEYPNSSVSIADAFSNGYVISFASSDEKIKEKTGHFTILVDSNGKTTKFLNLGENREKDAGVYKQLKVSPDGSKIIYSLGATGANVFLYDILNEKVTKVSEESVVYSAWSKNSKAIYYITMQSGENSTTKYILKRFDIK